MITQDRSIDRLTVIFERIYVQVMYASCLYIYRYIWDSDDTYDIMIRKRFRDVWSDLQRDSDLTCLCWDMIGIFRGMTEILPKMRAVSVFFVPLIYLPSYVVLVQRGHWPSVTWGCSSRKWERTPLWNIRRGTSYVAETIRLVVAWPFGNCEKFMTGSRLLNYGKVSRRS